MGKFLSFVVAATMFYTASAPAAAVYFERNEHANFCRCVVLTSQCLTGAGVVMMEKLDFSARDFKTWKGPFMQNTFSCDGKEGVQQSLLACEVARKIDTGCSLN